MFYLSRGSIPHRQAYNVGRAIGCQQPFEPPHKEVRTKLSDILGEEIAKRGQRNVEARSKLAHFPFKRTLEGFDVDFQPSVDKDLATLSFLSEAVNVVFLGPPGVGKSHLSVALGMEAINHGISVHFTKAHDMLADLKKAYREAGSAGASPCTSGRSCSFAMKSASCRWTGLRPTCSFRS